jgi:hypothetical protein
MRDLHNNITVKRAISPVSVSDNTAAVSQIIDCQDHRALEFLIATGSLGDAACTFTTLVEHGDEADLSDAAAVPDSQLLGTEAGASFDQSKDDSVFKIGYRGYKRYVRLTITPADNATASLLSAVAVLGHPRHAPTS